MTRETNIVITELESLARKIRTMNYKATTYEISRLVENRIQQLEKTDTPLGSIGPKELLP